MNVSVIGTITLVNTNLTEHTQLTSLAIQKVINLLRIILNQNYFNLKLVKYIIFPYFLYFLFDLLLYLTVQYNICDWSTVIYSHWFMNGMRLPSSCHPYK